MVVILEDPLEQGRILAEAARTVGCGQQEGGLRRVELLVFDQLHEIAQHDSLRIALVAGSVLAAKLESPQIFRRSDPGVVADGAERGSQQIRAPVRHPGKPEGPSGDVRFVPCDRAMVGAAQCNGFGQQGERRGQSLFRALAVVMA